jgi:hypothetical protein
MLELRIRKRVCTKCSDPVHTYQIKAIELQSEFWWGTGKKYRLQTHKQNKYYINFFSMSTYLITKQPHLGVFHAKGTVVVSTVQVKKFKKYKFWDLQSPTLYC